MEQDGQTAAAPAAVQVPPAGQADQSESAMAEAVVNRLIAQALQRLANRLDETCYRYGGEMDAHEAYSAAKIVMVNALEKEAAALLHATNSSAT